MTDVHTKTEGFTDLEDFNCKYHVHEEFDLSVLQAYCGLYGTPWNARGSMIVQCQFAAEINYYGQGRVIAALCYQDISGNTNSRWQSQGGEMCKKWRYPGTQLPQLQLPEYLRSRDAKILWYEPANLESFNGYSSGSREVATTRWIRNTYERTGFSGMGKLPEYGPNKALYLLITRYSSGTTKYIVEQTGNYISLPRFWVKKATIDADVIKRKVQKLNQYCNPSEINVMVQTRQKYHVGYLKNRQNTDNAWLEGAIIHLHDNSDRGCFGPYPVHSEVATRQYSWQVLPHITTPRDFARTFGMSAK
ncbi:hypothetical protein TTRE_0000329701 [Trichuris trichiura]|uniref:Uncharacterized protein n=1 Tax=Trichuris trichiura TaxID=36087 RepID=A0A077Z4K8_TRITR|nr:hypothetical protein TTRE_0000329701 [Trichuris trichiura]